MYQGLYEEAKNNIRQNAYMNFYDALNPLYLQRDASSISLDAGLLEVRDNMKCG